MFVWVLNLLLEHIYAFYACIIISKAAIQSYSRKQVFLNRVLEAATGGVL